MAASDDGSRRSVTCSAVAHREAVDVRVRRARQTAGARVVEVDRLSVGRIVVRLALGALGARAQRRQRQGVVLAARLDRDPVVAGYERHVPERGARAVGGDVRRAPDGPVRLHPLERDDPLPVASSRQTCGSPVIGIRYQSTSSLADRPCITRLGSKTDARSGWSLGSTSRSATTDPTSVTPSW